MRRTVTTIVAVMTVLGGGSVIHGDGDAKAADVLKAAREALGGAPALASISSIMAKGKHRRTMGDMQVNGDTEISIVLPDKYLRSQTDTMMGSTVTRETGFNGDAPLERSHTHGGGPGMVIRMAGPGGNSLTPEERSARLLRAQRDDYARLMLGWLAAAPAFTAATYSYAGEAESPDGRAHVIDVKGTDEFAAKLFIDQATNRPLMLTYMAPRPLVRVFRSGPQGGHGGHSGATREQARRDVNGQEPPPVVEHQLFFEDFRQVGRIWLPHRLSRSIDGDPVEELAFERIRINEDIKPSTFDTKQAP